MKEKELLPKWMKRVTCPNCETKRLVEIGQQRCKCPNCKTIYKVR